MSNSTVLIVGGTGVFGSRLALGLLKELGLDLVIAGRDLGAADAFCQRHGGRPLRLDRTAPDLPGQAAALGPDLVTDAAGPFQGYGPEPYWPAARMHLDLSDDADFTLGVAALDEAARRRGVTVLPGASGVPALSSATVEKLAQRMADIYLIESMILPGTRLPGLARVA